MVLMVKMMWILRTRMHYCAKVADLSLHFRKQSATDGMGSNISRVWRLDSGPNLQPCVPLLLKPPITGKKRLKLEQTFGIFGKFFPSLGPLKISYLF